MAGTRKTQTSVEVLARPDNAKVRATQVAVEVLVKESAGGNTARAYVIMVG